MTKTGWYTGEQKPVRIGVYEKNPEPGKFMFSFWSGDFWGYMCWDIDSALRSRNYKSNYQKSPWRGVKK